MDLVAVQILTGIGLIGCAVATMILLPGRRAIWSPPAELDPTLVLRARLEGLRAAVGQLPIAILVLDRDGFVRDGAASPMFLADSNALPADLRRSLGAEDQHRIMRYTSTVAPFHTYVYSGAPAQSGEGVTVCAIDLTTLLQSLREDEHDDDIDEIISRLRSES